MTVNIEPIREEDELTPTVTASSLQKPKGENNKHVLFLDGFHKVPWMMEKLEGALEEQSTITYEVMNCFQRDPKTMARSVDESSIPRVEQALQSGKFHALVVADLNAYFDELIDNFGTILQRFCRDGGAIALTASEMSGMLSAICTKLFDTTWLAGDYLSSTWVMASENERIPDYWGEENLVTSFSGQFVSLLNVPKQERIYGVDPSQRGMQLPNTQQQQQQQQQQAQEEMKIDVEAMEDDYNVCVAVHNYYKGCVGFLGDVNLDKPELLERFLQFSSPTKPIEAFSRLSKETFDRVKNLKKKGNDAFVETKYEAAIEAYQKAIALYETKSGSAGPQQYEHATLYSNLAECHLKLGQYPDSIAAATNALQRSPTMTKAAIRYAKARVVMAEKEHNRHYLELARGILDHMAPESKDDKRAIQDMIKKVKQMSLQMDKKKKNGFRSGFSAALSSA
jgi:tetratricopeptide (TPR) repeat protein